MLYIAKCKKGKVVAAAVANTPLEQAEAASEVKSWIKSGLIVELTESKTYEWCLNAGTKECKKCSRD